MSKVKVLFRQSNVFGRAMLLDLESLFGSIRFSVKSSRLSLCKCGWLLKIGCIQGAGQGANGAQPCYTLNEPLT